MLPFQLAEIKQVFKCHFISVKHATQRSKAWTLLCGNACDPPPEKSSCSTGLAQALTCQKPQMQKEARRTERLRPKPLWWPAGPCLSLESQTLPQTPCLLHAPLSFRLTAGTPPARSKIADSRTTSGFSRGVLRRRVRPRTGRSESGGPEDWGESRNRRRQRFLHHRLHDLSGGKHLHTFHMHVFTSPYDNRLGYFCPSVGAASQERGEKTAGHPPDRFQHLPSPAGTFWLLPTPFTTKYNHKTCSRSYNGRFLSDRLSTCYTNRVEEVRKTLKWHKSKCGNDAGSCDTLPFELQSGFQLRPVR